MPKKKQVYVEGPIPTSITMLDYFAAAALAGLTTGEQIYRPKQAAELAYQYAGAMLAARQELIDVNTKAGAASPS